MKKITQTTLGLVIALVLIIVVSDVIMDRIVTDIALAFRARLLLNISIVLTTVVVYLLLTRTKYVRH